MSNHWAISVGINQYQFFQPLSYAQRDAQELRNLLIENAGFLPDHCLLLTETSPSVLGKSTYPSLENIQGWFDLLTQNYLQPGDLLWCFFSGYGVCFQGEDYLVPIEGNPNALSTTALSLRSLFSKLQPWADNTLVLLDINRSQGMSGEAVGIQTATLARESQISTILSCHPDQFSREVSGLGHGFFTAALLESLRSSQGDTLISLNRYLDQRIPELSEHYWQPLQQPLAVIHPPEKLNQVILPNPTAKPLFFSVVQAAAERKQGSGSIAATPSWASSLFSNRQPAPSVNGSPNGNGKHSTPSPTPVVVPVATNGVKPAPLQDHSPMNGATSASMAPEPDRQPTPQPENSSPPEEGELADTVFWRRVILGGTAIAALLSLGVWLRNRPESAQSPPSPSANQLLPAPSPDSVASPAVQTSPSPLPNPTSQGSPNPAPGIGKDGSSSSKPTAGNSTPSATGKPSTNPGKPTPIAKTTTPIGKATGSPVPGNASKPAAVPAQDDPLVAARRLIRPGQASRYSQAIAKAREIKPGHPRYAEAQESITQWSRVIFNLAKRRAEQEKFPAAIAAARLVPRDQTPLYAEAQKMISQWELRQRQQSGQLLLLKAERLIQPGQASSYNRAIATLRRIKPGQPEYGEAQKLIARWSQAIFSLAQARASRQELTSAIEAASMVPRDAAIYPKVQQAIAIWKRRSNG